MKGLAIGNQPRLAQAHNSYAKPETSVKKSSSSMPSSSSSSNLLASVSSSNLVASNGASQVHFAASNEIFHFICFVPINGKLYELDGLKPYPIDHGAIEPTTCNLNLIDELLKSENCDLKNTLANLRQNYRHGSLNWSEKFKKIILQRLKSHGQQNHEIRFNLMAVVGDNMLKYRNQLQILEGNRRIFLNILNEDLGLLRDERKEFFFSLRSHHLVDSLIEDVAKNGDIVSGEFVEALCKLVHKFDLVEISKVFQVNQDGVCESVVKKSASISELRGIEAELRTEIESVRTVYNEEVDKRKRYATEAFRRKHVYNEFIVSYLKVLAENGKLEEIVRNSVTNKSASGNSGDSKLTASSFFISPNSLFVQQNSNKKFRKK
ncbi:ubiquitin carboxyl-terminal hydrolase calypso [Brachionus plicatilis]|uniref:ubiquitinyl hydrolase 1 n=1 Tax=Brachionus plicatilis TaxID=10195 RepID=A0A3M7RA34_BRAPC|nr:ubiquitin carboxyl-terminal hydrolase calypso [Brachionus plicatilis]